MLFKNISKRRIRVNNIYLEPNEQCDLPERSAHVRTFLHMKWLGWVLEPPVSEPPVSEPPVSEPPVSEPPVSEPPVSESVLEPPVSEPMSEDAFDENTKKRGRKSKW